MIRLAWSPMATGVRRRRGAEGEESVAGGGRHKPAGGWHRPSNQDQGRLAGLTPPG